jgi:nitrite reductase (NADH) small subunit/3-phenylpropionate/trans-cinnamate dioxygenase ferredoxin subunit
MPRQIVVARVGEIKEGEAKTVHDGRKGISVFYAQGVYYAIDDMCPHAGASLAGGFVEDGIVTCPWHYWRFRLKDGAWADNPRIKTGTYPVHVVGDEVCLELPDLPVANEACPGGGGCSPT